MEDMMDAEQLAAYLKVSQSTLNHWRVNGEGPPFYKLGPAFVRYKISEVNEWANSKRQTSTSQARSKK